MAFLRSTWCLPLSLIFPPCLIKNNKYIMIHMAHTMPKWNLLIWNEQPATNGWHPECDTSLDLNWCATFLMQGAILDDVVLKDLRHDRKGRLLRPLLLTGAVNLWHLLSSILSLQRLWDVSSSKIYINIYNIKINIIHIIYIYMYIDHISLQIRFLPTLPRSRSLCSVPFCPCTLVLYPGQVSKPRGSSQVGSSSLHQGETDSCLIVPVQVATSSNSCFKRISQTDCHLQYSFHLLPVSFFIFLPFKTCQVTLPDHAVVPTSLISGGHGCIFSTLQTIGEGYELPQLPHTSISHQWELWVKSLCPG